MTRLFPRRFILSVSLVAATLAFAACSQEFKDLSASVLGSTGLVSSSQAKSFLDVAEKSSKALRGLTEEQEYYLGRAVAATILAKYKPVRNAALISYVNRVGTGLAANSDRPETFGGYHFMVLDTDEVNALSGPGGFVFITRGLLSKMPDEDALASVLAHEVGHIVLGHGVSAISKSNLTEALLIVGKEAASSYGSSEVQALTTAFGDSVNDVAETILTKGFSRGQEYDADEYAAALLTKTGYNASGLVSMLESLEKGTSSSGWYSTHPAPSKRKSEVLDIVKVTPPDEGQKVRTARFKSNVKPG